MCLTASSSSVKVAIGFIIMQLAGSTQLLKASMFSTINYLRCLSSGCGGVVCVRVCVGCVWCGVCVCVCVCVCVSWIEEGTSRSAGAEAVRVKSNGGNH